MSCKKNILIGCSVFFCGMLVHAAPIVSAVKAQQRYPWNGMVDIDYTILGDATGLKIEIGVEDRQAGKTYFPTKFLSALSTSAGQHRVTWSTEAEGVTIVSTNVAVTVSLVTVSGELTQKNQYYVVDLSDGPTAASYPVTTMETSSEPEWTSEYKTTKLVLRRIEAGEDPLKRYKLTKPFYIGVFEVTQKQYELVTGANPAYYKGETRAVSEVSYNSIRGDLVGAGWPSSSDVDETSFLGVLRKKTGIPFDLPTEAQWEYACRAGTTVSYNNGGDSESDLKTLGRYSGNGSDGRGGYSGVTTVGSYAPNAWGLYDMHGNVREWCLDWHDSSVPLTGADPKGVASGGSRVVRGGSCDNDASRSASSRRDYDGPDNAGFYPNGFRLACSVLL